MAVLPVSPDDLRRIWSSFLACTGRNVSASIRAAVKSRRYSPLPRPKAVSSPAHAPPLTLYSKSARANVLPALSRKMP